MQVKYNGSTKINDTAKVEDVKTGTVIAATPRGNVAPDTNDIFIVVDKDQTSVMLMDPINGDFIPVARVKVVKVLESCLYYQECQSQNAADRKLK